MPCELEKLFGPLADRVPTSSDEDFVFSVETLPSCPPRISTDRIHIQRGVHTYDPDFRMDVLLFSAHKRTYRNLALLILSIVFHAEPVSVEIEIMHPASAIKHLIAGYEHASHGYLLPSYWTVPYAFRYWPGNASSHPWADDRVEPRDLPRFSLTNAARGTVTEEEWQQRDTVVGFGSDAGSVRLAALLLDASRPENTVDDYALEGDGGFRGVAPFSAEARIWLPGAYWWDESAWETPETRQSSTGSGESPSVEDRT